MASLCKNLRLARHGASYLSQRLGAMRTFSSNSPLLSTRPHLQVKSDQSSSARILAPRAFHNVAQQTGDSEPKLDSLATPAHYLVQIDSFSRLHEIEKFETGVFEAGGYKWKLKIYKGDKTENVAVKLALSDTSALSPENWKLDAFFSISLKNQTSGSHFFLSERAFFDATNTEWGGFLPTDFLTDPSHGYLKDDMCVFGAEVFVNRNELVTENMSLKNVKPPPYKREFKIPNFPSRKESGGWVSHQTWTSDVFSVGGHKWMLKVSPKGWTKGIGRLSIYLENIVDSKNVYASDEDSDETSEPDSDDDSEDSSDTESDGSSNTGSDDSSDEDSDDDSLGCIKASYTMTLKSQYGNHVVDSISSSRFSASEGDQMGWYSFIDLASLYDPDKGFILNDSIHLELELSVEEEDNVSD